MLDRKERGREEEGSTRLTKEGEGIDGVGKERKGREKE